VLFKQINLILMMSWFAVCSE